MTTGRTQAQRERAICTPTPPDRHGVYRPQRSISRHTALSAGVLDSLAAVFEH